MLSDTMTALMDKARELTGLTEKISIARLTSLMNHFDLHVNPNLLPERMLTFTLSNNDYWNYESTYGSLKIEPNVTYTFSWRAKTNGKNSKVRIRLIDIKDNAKGDFLIGPSHGYEFPLTDKLQSFTFKVPSDYPYDLTLYGNGTNLWDKTPVVFYDCKLEVGDLATPLNPVGGVTKLPLFAFLRGGACYAA